MPVVTACFPALAGPSPFHLTSHRVGDAPTITRPVEGWEMPPGEPGVGEESLWADRSPATVTLCVAGPCSRWFLEPSLNDETTKPMRNARRRAESFLYPDLPDTGVTRDYLELWPVARRCARGPFELTPCGCPRTFPELPSPCICPAPLSLVQAPNSTLFLPLPSPPCLEPPTDRSADRSRASRSFPRLPM